MKRIVIHPEEPKTGKRYWRSLSEYGRTPEFQEKLGREFMDGQSEMKDEADAEVSRRNFLKLMGASTAMAGLAACRRPEQFIKPYAKPPEWVIPGKALFYATAMPRLGGCTPLVVTSFEGRPTHLAGNALHPESNGGLDVYAQASVLGLFDPDRARDFLSSGKKSTREEFEKALGEKKTAWAANGGEGVALLLDENNSPTRARLVGDLKKKLAKLKVFKYEPVSLTTLQEATAAAFGDGVVQVYHFDKADKVLSLDCDFMGVDRLGNNSTAEFMKARRAPKPGYPMNRLYSVEGRYSVTGGMADHRLRLAPSQILSAAAKLAELLGVAGGPKAADLGETAKVWLEEAAKDLLESKGKALVVAGPNHSKEVQILVAAINNALGAVGSVIELKQGEKREAGSLADLAKEISSGAVKTLVAITEADPAFDAPTDLNWVEVQKQVETILLSTRHKTQTARLAAWALPGTHYLEQWGDVRSTDGTYSIIQPMILPLFNGLSDVQFLSLLLVEKSDKPAEPPPPTLPGAPEDPGAEFKAVRATFDALCKAANKDDAWNFALRDGFLPESGYPAATAVFNTGSVAATASAKLAPAPTPELLEVNLVPCGKVYDGRYINNGWLQEAPDPVTKVTWDNAALVSFKTAKALGIKTFTITEEADKITLTIDGKTVHLPVVVVPGHADNVVTVAMGYGQPGKGAEGPGLVGEGTGFNVFPLRTTANPFIISGVKVLNVGLTHALALTQEHSAMYGRALVREGTAADWKEKPDFVLEMGSDAHVHGTREEKYKGNHYSFYKPVGGKDAKGEPIPHLNDDLHQWGMVIDLNQCIGCSTCLVACQSENNIPIVGKEQVIRGREMHWIRMDRYFATDLDDKVNPETSVWEEDYLDDPEMVVQPVACQHCESAPCETVCPVNATVHSPDGLNVMVYNRCIGTRYCANNCPFKARHFNFFDYNKRNPLSRNTILGVEHNNLYSGPFGERWDTELSKLQKNPNVSVRMRGVMEKCTYCLQRIESARIEARATARKQAAYETGKSDETLEIAKEKLAVKDGAVKAACQQACPADAIAFGNIADPKSKVSQWRQNSRNYELLAYLAITARTTYLARIKNPNAKLLEKVEYERKKAGNASKYHQISSHGAGHGHAATEPAKH